MKVNYICEVCGKTHESEKAAIQCEERHATLARQREENAQKEAKLLDAIDSAVNLYVSKYHKMPPVTLTEENQDILIEAMARVIFEPIINS